MLSKGFKMRDDMIRCALWDNELEAVDTGTFVRKQLHEFVWLGLGYSWWLKWRKWRRDGLERDLRDGKHSSPNSKKRKSKQDGHVCRLETLERKQVWVKVTFVHRVTLKCLWDIEKEGPGRHVWNSESILVRRWYSKRSVYLRFPRPPLSD